jgi:lysophospholipase L1-like esterase
MQPSTTARPAARRRSQGLRLCLAAAVALFAFGCFEVLMQVADPGGFAELEDRERFNAEVLAKGDDGILRLVPGVTSYLGHEVRISEQRLRNRVVATPKPANTFRVLVVGDSVPFGWGVGEADPFPVRLEALLRGQPRADGRSYEVINAGSPGWGVYEEFTWLRDHGMAFDPDLVVHCIINNDIEPGAKSPPLFLTPELRRVRTLRLLERIVEKVAGDRGTDGPGLSPEVVNLALDEFQKLCAAAPARYVVFDLFGLAPATVEHAARIGAVHVACALTEQWVHAHQVTPHDYHPNSSGHAWLAERLFEALRPLLQP